MSRKKILKHKLDLLQEFAHPTPFPESMFLKLPKGSSNQQPYVILGRKGTGKYVYKIIYVSVEFHICTLDYLNR